MLLNAHTHADARTQAPLNSERKRRLIENGFFWGGGMKRSGCSEEHKAKGNFESSKVPTITFLSFSFCYTLEPTNTKHDRLSTCAQVHCSSWRGRAAGGRREHVTTKSKCKTQIKTIRGNFSVRLYISSWKVSKVLGFLLLMQQTTLYDFFKSPSLQVMSRFLHVSSMYANFINQHAGYLPELRLPVPLVSTMSKRCSFMEISINPAPSCTYSIHYMGDLFIFKEE